MVAGGKCKKHDIDRVAKKNSRNGTYFACPKCDAEKKAGGGLPPSPPPKKRGRPATKQAAKKAAKKTVKPVIPPKPEDTPKAGGFWNGFKRMHGLG